MTDLNRSSPYVFKGRVYKCADCEWAGDSPMLMDEVWESIAKTQELLCTGCVESRLGRELEIADLKVCPMNSSTLYMMKKNHD
jgi:hypothetical protein